MRPPIPVTDAMVAREFRAHGLEGDADVVHPAVRAALQAAVRAQIQPNPRVRRAPPASSIASVHLRPVTDNAKMRAANDFPD